MALPGMTISTSPTDYRINKQMQMMKFNGERWELFGPIISDIDTPFPEPVIVPKQQRL